MIRILSAVMLMFIACASNGAVVEIDFEGVAPPGEGTGSIDESAPHLEDGFVLFGTSGENAIIDSAIPEINTNVGHGSDGSDVFGWCGDCGTPIQQIVLFAGDEGPEVPFNLHSLQATDLLILEESSGTPGDLVVEGETLGGGFVTTTFDLSDAWTTFIFPNTFTNMEYVIFQASDDNVRSLGIDYIIVEAVPVPAAVWLFGSGLIGLIGIARRKKS